MEKHLFDFSKKKPYFTVSLSDATPEETICTIRNAVFDGADAFLIHLERMKEEYHNEATLKRIFAYAEDKPIMTLHYRSKEKPELTDDDLTKVQFASIRAGASCVDVMEDLFDPELGQLAKDPSAVKKQKAYIDEIHKMGAQVLISSHILYKPTAQILEHAEKIQERGADIVKIAMRVDTPDQMDEATLANIALNKQLKTPFLFICRGKYGKANRMLAPIYGSCMVLCVQRYTVNGHKEKPILRSVKAVYDNLNYKPYGEGVNSDEF